MERSYSQWQMAGFIFTSIMGTLLHFLYDISGESLLVAPFSAINESIWEHMKLLYFPMLAFAWIEYAAMEKPEGKFWCIKLMGMLLGLMLIPILYYTYKGVFGKNIDWFNIAIYFLVAGLVFWVEVRLFQRKASCRIPSWTAVLLLLLIGGIFVVWTFRPPRIPLFRDPLTGNYGVVRDMIITPALP